MTYEALRRNLNVRRWGSGRGRLFMVSGWALHAHTMVHTRDNTYARQRGTEGTVRWRVPGGWEEKGEAAAQERVWRGLKIARGRTEYAETVRYALATRYLYLYR